MSLLSDVTFAKITARVAKIDTTDRKVQNIFKFKITTGGNVVKTWSMFFLIIFFFEFLFYFIFYLSS